MRFVLIPAGSFVMGAPDSETRVRERTADVLGQQVLAYLRGHAQIADPRVRSYCRFLFEAYPHWMGAALKPVARGG